MRGRSRSSAREVAGPARNRRPGPVPRRRDAATGACLPDNGRLRRILSRIIRGDESCALHDSSRAAFAAWRAARPRASADYYLKIDSVARETAQGPIYLKAQSSGDLDGDGLPDSAVIRIDLRRRRRCPTAQYQVTSPRDAASGQATGKRMHKPFTIVKEWGAATPAADGDEDRL